MGSELRWEGQAEKPFLYRIPQRIRALSTLLAPPGITPCLPASLTHWPIGQRCWCLPDPQTPETEPLATVGPAPPLSARARHHLLQLTSPCLSVCLCLSLSLLQPRTCSEQKACGLTGSRKGEDIGAKKESVSGTSKRNGWITGIILHLLV